MSQIISATSSAITISATIGCANASHSTVPTASSSPNDAAQFENGSGDVLMTARLPDFARWLPAASVPPRIAAASIMAVGRIAEHARGERGAGRNPDERLHDVPGRIHAGHLVGEELDQAHEARRREHQRMREHVESRRQVDPVRGSPGPPTMNSTAYKPQAARPADGGGERHQLQRVEMRGCGRHRGLRKSAGIQPAARLPRNAATPSLPSGDARTVAMWCTVRR